MDFFLGCRKVTGPEVELELGAFAFLMAMADEERPQLAKAQQLLGEGVALLRMCKHRDAERTLTEALAAARDAAPRAEADAVYDALDEPVPIEEMLLRTSKQDVLLFLSARFFNSFLASLFLMKALDVTIKSADLPASMAALIDDGMLEKYNVSSTSELGALQIRARACLRH